MTTKDLIEKLKKYPENAEIIFYYKDGLLGESNEAIYDPEFNHLPNANYLEITIC